RPDADHWFFAARRNRFGHVGDPVAGYFGYEDFTAFGVFNGPQHHVNAFLQADIEAGHARIGDRQHAGFATTQEKWNDRAAAAHDIAVAHHRETDVAITANVVGGGKQLVGAQFGGAIQIDRGGGFVGAQGNH